MIKNGIDITNKKLIEHCEIMRGICFGCPPAYRFACNLFYKQYGTTPFHEGFIHPDRFTDDIIFTFVTTEIIAKEVEKE